MNLLLKMKYLMSKTAFSTFQLVFISWFILFLFIVKLKTTETKKLILLGGIPITAPLK